MAPDHGAYLEKVVVMNDYLMITPLSDLELDAVTGGTYGNTYNRTFNIRQNARGGDSVAFGGNGGNATTSGVGAAVGGVGGVATSGVGGAGGTNTIRGPL